MWYCRSIHMPLYSINLTRCKDEMRCWKENEKELLFRWLGSALENECTLCLNILLTYQDSFIVKNHSSVTYCFFKIINILVL